MPYSNRDPFFRRLNLTVMLFNCAYSGVYFYLGARFSALMSLFCGLAVFPFTLFLNRMGYHVISRFLFIFGALLAIYSTSLGIGFDLHEDYYYLPATMLSLLIFDPKEKGKVLIGVFIPLIGYLLTHWGPHPNWGPFWSPIQFPAALFRVLNFSGAFLITLLFLSYYGKYLRSLQEAVLRELNRSKSVERSLEEAQGLGKIGSFSWNVITNIETYSKEALRIYGHDSSMGAFKPEDRLGRYFPEDRQMVKTYLADLMSGQDHLDFQSRLLLPDGSIRHVRHQGRTIKDSRGRVQEVLMTIQDITEQEHVYQMLMQSSKMSALGEMASGIAHEINNPLTIIQVMSEQIKSVVDRPQSADLIKECSEKIETTVWRIAKIIKGLRLFARQSDSIPFEVSDLRSIVDETLSFCTENIAANGIQLHFSPPAQNFFVDCRPVQISQALLNLLNNSCAAVASLPEKWIRLEISEKNSQIEISVTDSGSGIPVSLQNKLFHPFFTTKEVGEGTGLGLSITKGIIETHKGTITYDKSSANTRFVMTLPRAPEAGPEV